MRSQRTFQTNACSLTGCSEPTTEDQILNAEILQALNMIDENYSFSSENGDSGRFKKLFPDSQIAAKYYQGETKPKYVVQFDYGCTKNWVLLQIRQNYKFPSEKTV